MTPFYWIWVNNIIVTQCSTCVQLQNFAFRQWRTKVSRHFHQMAPFLHIRHLYPPQPLSPKIRNQCCKSNYNVFVVVQFYSWFKFYFPLVLTCYHPLTVPKTKFQPGKKLNRIINLWQYWPWIPDWTFCIFFSLSLILIWRKNKTKHSQLPFYGL